MIYIWLAIITGVILVPIISGATKELEKKLEKLDDGKENGVKVWKFNFKDKDDIRFIIKILTYALVIIFTAIVIMMVKFTGSIIYNN